MGENTAEVVEKPKMVTVAAKVPVELHDAAKAKAKANSATLGAAVLRGLELYVQES